MAQIITNVFVSVKPHNPMINAGAILICALLKTLVKPEMTMAEKFDFTMNYFEVSPVFIVQNKIISL